LFGWDFGQVAPWTWVISTIGATGTLDIFNAGVAVKPTTALPDQTVWEDDGTLPGGVSVSLKIAGFELPIGAPPGDTIFATMLVKEGAIFTWTGSFSALYPTAIAVHSPFPMVNVAPSGGTFPNPLKITPAIWNFE